MKLAVFLSGYSCAAFLAAAIFFLKFWRTSRDPFYVYFAAGCGLIGLERVVAVFLNGTFEPVANSATEASSWVYLLRLAAFVFIGAAVLDKNRKSL